MTSNQSTLEERAQVVGDALGKFIMLWAADELINDLVSAPSLHSDLCGATENFCTFEPGFLHYRAGLAD